MQIVSVNTDPSGTSIDQTGKLTITFNRKIELDPTRQLAYIKDDVDNAVQVELADGSAAALQLPGTPPEIKRGVDVVAAGSSVTFSINLSTALLTNPPADNPVTFVYWPLAIQGLSFRPAGESKGFTPLTSIQRVNGGSLPGVFSVQTAVTK